MFVLRIDLQIRLVACGLRAAPAMGQAWKVEGWVVDDKQRDPSEERTVRPVAYTLYPPNRQTTGKRTFHLNSFLPLPTPQTVSDSC